MTRARGRFEVTMRPLTSEGQFDELPLSRMSIDKQFEGDLRGISKGEMLAALTSVQGSAGYVAMERVNGSLEGRNGTFVLQHSGTMTRGKQQLTITVVPDSGTGDLTGLSGTMTIDVGDGNHSYEFDYVLREVSSD